MNENHNTKDKESCGQDEGGPHTIIIDEESRTRQFVPTSKNWVKAVSEA